MVVGGYQLVVGWSQDVGDRKTMPGQIMSIGGYVVWASSFGIPGS